MTVHGPYLAGAAQADVTPADSVFLFGYPHVPRMSTGTYDPLLASALAVQHAQHCVIFVGVDVIWVPKAVSDRAAERIAAQTGVPRGHVLISATHTHSGPVTSRMPSNLHDTVVPDPDPAYLEQLCEGIVRAAVTAHGAMRPATLRYAVADGSALGTNRRDPDGPAIPRVPVLGVYDHQTDEPVAVMAVCSMHPTVLHEDSTLISGDFPGLARRHLQAELGSEIPLVYHMGASGDQSPRHVVQHNTFDEADRLGATLATAILEALRGANALEPQPIQAAAATLNDLPRRDFPSTQDARKERDAARQKLATLRQQAAPRAEVRTAETDWFGAEETLTLSELAEDGRLPPYLDACLPIRIQAIRLGPVVWIGWPGEVFVEYALQVMNRYPDASVITLSGGDLQGYVVTQQAIDEGAYEAGNAAFKSPDAGRVLVEATLGLLQELEPTAESAR